nr:MAG TPA: hypothetical protein [Bacteriophage sp.]
MVGDMIISGYLVLMMEILELVLTQPSIRVGD